MDLVVVQKADNTLSYVSPSIKRLLGYEPGEMVGEVGADYIHPEDLEWAWKKFYEMLETPGISEPIVIRYQHKDGSWRYFESICNNRMDDPAVGGLVFNCRDVTDRVRAEEEIRRLNASLEDRVKERTARLEAALNERKQAEEEIRKLNEQLEHRVQRRTAQLEAFNRELEAFSYSVSHDLRAPLRSIDGFSRILLEDYADEVNEEGKDYMKRVRAASQRMGQLIDDLLNMSRLTRSEMRRERIDLSALVEGLVEELKRAQPERGAELVIEKELVVEGDRRLLGVAVENLLRNAWKFTREQPRARIEFGVTEHQGTLAYFVRDNGAGFDMAYADKLFGAFQRLHRVDEFEGNGIGLATVQRIIHRHGGRVWAEGRVGHGATFYFTL